MADNYNIDKWLSLVFWEEKEASGSSQNFTSDEVGNANPEAEQNEIQAISYLENDRGFSASSFSREPRVSASLPTPPSYGYSFDIPTSNPLAGAEQSILAAPEENPLNSFLVPVVASRGGFCRTDDPQSYPSEQSSFLHNIDWNIPGNASFGYENSTFREKRNNPEEFFLQLQPSYSDSASSPQMSTKRDGYEATAQTKEDYIQLRTNAIFSQIDNIPNMEVATERGLLGSFAGAETVSAGGPSGILTQSRGTGKEKLQVCDVCGKALATKYSLQMHMKTHTGDKTFQCKYCSYSSARNSTLTRHLRTHTGDKPFACSFCSDRFAQNSTLTNHLRTHTGDKPFACSLCSDSFSQKSNLTRHLRTHTGDKPFACSCCSDRFAQKSTLTTHLRIHTGERPYKCKFCPLRFAHQVSCMRHQKTQHAEKISSELK